MTETKAVELQEKARVLLAPFGLSPFGWFTTEEGQPALLVGNIGSSLWPAFSDSVFAQNGEADPMNRWTVAILEPVGSALHATLRYPFGEKVWPFQHYAKLATGMEQSPIGLLIHPEYGLWCAFRGALVFDAAIEVPGFEAGDHPCSSCTEKPCLTICPVGAFSADGYDYESCKTHIRSDAGQACRTDGCLARRACPIGQDYAYKPDHQAFHMAAFA